MKFNTFIGIDVSKEKLDFLVLIEGAVLFHMVVTNNAKGIKEFFKELDTKLKAGSSCLYCLEHTGIYCQPFKDYAVSGELSVWLESATKINAFHGAVRDKNDKVDARRIAEYAYAKCHSVQLWKPERELISRLKRLLGLRDRLVGTKTRLQVPCKEDEHYTDPKWHKEHTKRIKPIVKNLTDQIKQIEKDLQAIITEDGRLKELYQLVSSVKGVGLIVALNIIVVSNEFISITEPKKMACHCGIVPFNKQSGKSIKTRPRVSSKANKKMKALLNLSARSAVGSKGELQDFYLRKVAEGKNKMSVMNAVRNKIIHRVYACVRDNEKYENNYKHALA